MLTDKSSESEWRNAVGHTLLKPMSRGGSCVVVQTPLASWRRGWYLVLHACSLCLRNHAYTLRFHLWIFIRLLGPIVFCGFAECGGMVPVSPMYMYMQVQSGLSTPSVHALTTDHGVQGTLRLVNAARGDATTMTCAPSPRESTSSISRCEAAHVRLPQETCAPALGLICMLICASAC